MLLTMITKMLAIFLKVDEPAHFPPPLSLEEEQECFRLCRQGDDLFRKITDLIKSVQERLMI